MSNKRVVDFYYVTGDKGCLIGFWKDKENIPLPASATVSWDVHEGYLQDRVKMEGLFT